MPSPSRSAARPLRLQHDAVEHEALEAFGLGRYHIPARTPAELRAFDRKREGEIQRLASQLRTHAFIPEPASLIFIPKPTNDTEKWLAAHTDDGAVRTQYLAFIQQLPKELDELRKRAALITADWLQKHAGSNDVCQAYVSFLLALRHLDLAELEADSVIYHRWIVAENPGRIGHRFILGEQLLRLKKFEEAKTEYEQVLAREPRHQLAHRGLAIALQNLGHSKEAEDSFRKAPARPPARRSGTIRSRPT